MSEINDKFLLDEVCDLGEQLKSEGAVKKFRKEPEEDPDEPGLIYPLDETVLKELKTIQQKGLPGEEKELTYKVNGEIDRLWNMLIEKSIICLRFFDKREPFMENGKHQYIFGMDKLTEYHQNYIAFEGVLYGSDAYYRDHVFHVIRVWLLGVYLLLNRNAYLTADKTRLIDQFHFEGELASEPLLAEPADSERARGIRPEDCALVAKGNDIYKVCQRISKEGGEEYFLAEAESFSSEINILEKLSMWTIMALCHDLGYPLEKSKKILVKTEEMMAAFVSNPYVEKSIKFDGTQDSNNLDIITFMSKKMKPAGSGDGGADGAVAQYKASIQDKYKFKYKLSLENFSHGIVSAIIIYKMLIYFIETDNNPDADYIFGNEDARQFYIRRDILRAISSHTCKNIYHIDVVTFPMILFVCDELQEWGRKSWKSLYQGAAASAVTLEIKAFNAQRIEYTESIKMGNASEEQLVNNVKRIIEKQYKLYLTTFRDGQYTARRNFDYIKHILIDSENHYKSIKMIKIDFSINSSKQNEFTLTIIDSGNDEQKELASTVTTLKERLKSLIKSYGDKKNCGKFEFKDDGVIEK